HRPISICFVGKKLFLIFNKMFTISPCHTAGCIKYQQHLGAKIPGLVKVIYKQFGVIGSRRCNAKNKTAPA
ncbi:hypothetical protein ACV1CZ_22125, partial [Aeromonas caviae]